MRDWAGKSGTIGLAILIALVFGLFTSLCKAEAIYVAQTAGGLGNGQSPTDPKDITFLNDPGNWSSPRKIPGEIGPGDIIHLVGTITSQIVVQMGGTSNDPIELLFEPGAIMTSPAWPNHGAISIPMVDGVGQGYVIIDGGGNGIIENTDNGTDLGHQIDSTGIWLQEPHHVTIRNLTIRNLYVHPAPSPDPHSYGVCVKAMTGDNNGPSTKVTVTHCVFHDARIGFYIAYGKNWSDFDYSFCTAYNCNWGGNAGDAYRFASISNLQVHNNVFRDWANWDDTSKANRNHHNGFYAWAVSGGTLRKISIYSNTVGPHFGGRATSGIYCSGNIEEVLIYNNLLMEQGAGDRPMDGLVFIFANLGAIASISRVYNNTFIGDGAGTAIDFASGRGPTITTYEAKNNLALNVSTFIAVYNNTSSTLISDNNLIFNSVSGNPRGSSLAFSSSPSSSAHFIPFEKWQALGSDQHSGIANPLLTKDFHPALGSPAVSKGVNLSSFFTDDKNGHLRPPIASWDIGAIQHD
jgi:hypothetical protein